MRFPKPWQRKGRGWFVTLDGRQVKLGNSKAEALEKYKKIIAQPRKVTVASDSVLAIIDVFLDWCHKHRAPDTYEWYRYRLERFAQKYPDLATADLRPFHVQEWIDEIPLSSGSKREMVLSSEEYETIFAATPNEDFLDLVRTTWETGCRPQESLQVEARHVDLVNQRWVFPISESKTEIPRVVYLTDTALAITKRRMKRYPAGKLFRNSQGKPWTTDAVNCCFVTIQIRMGRKLLNRQNGNQQICTNKRRKYLVDVEVVAE